MPEKCDKKFIECWSEQYPVSKYEKLYIDNIKKTKFTEKDITELYLWKNNICFSSKKEIAVKKYLKNIKYINELKQSKKAIDKDEFKKVFGEFEIWTIFLLHIIKPDEFPIFDQHVCRAFNYIKHKKIKEIPKSPRELEEVYYTEYLPFFKKILKDNNLEDKRTLDKALWAFGKSLKMKKIKS